MRAPLRLRTWFYWLKSWRLKRHLPFLPCILTVWWLVLIQWWLWRKRFLENLPATTKHGQCWLGFRAENIASLQACALYGPVVRRFFLTVRRWLFGRFPVRR